MSELRTATWPSHQRLEKRIDFKQWLVTATAYRAYLEKMWGFYAAIEPQLASGVFRDWLADYDLRRKVPLIERDLLALGADSTAVSLLPRCQSVPSCNDPVSAFGCAYVLEGATLGGKTLMPLVESRLGLSARHGAAFLASYGEAVEEKWRSFGEALNRCCLGDPDRARSAEAAAATFSALEHWFCVGRA
jgi:heme oxygenase